MQRKNFPLGEGGWGEEGSDEGSDEGSEEKSCENFLSILTFSREKLVLTKVVPYDTRSIKKMGCKFSHEPWENMIIRDEHSELTVSPSVGPP